MRISDWSSDVCSSDLVWLWLAGEGPRRRALMQQAARLGLGDRVRFLGWRDDVAALLRAADVFLCPSRHEPLGNVVIEAWAHGLARRRAHAFLRDHRPARRDVPAAEIGRAHV